MFAIMNDSCICVSLTQLFQVGEHIRVLPTVICFEKKNKKKTTPIGSCLCFAALLNNLKEHL